MERKKALLASAIIAASVMAGTVGYAASSNLTRTNQDNVGRLQPTSSLPPTITVIVDPATGSASVAGTAATATTAASGEAASTNSGRARGERTHEAEEEEGDD